MSDQARELLERIAAGSESALEESTLRVEGANFRPVTYEDGAASSSLSGLEPDEVDLLSVRLEARADLASGRSGRDYRVWLEDGRIETWTLELTGTGEVTTPDGRYQCLTFRLGNETRVEDGVVSRVVVRLPDRLRPWPGRGRAGALVGAPARFSFRAAGILGARQPDRQSGAGSAGALEISVRPLARPSTAPPPAPGWPVPRAHRTAP